MAQQKKKNINIKLTEDAADGIYSNLALITHSPAEFIFDFARIMPGTEFSKVHARVVMTPQHAKSLLKALEENIKKYENQYGEIKAMGTPPVDTNKKIGF
jgi:hypothetical protein